MVPAAGVPGVPTSGVLTGVVASSAGPGSHHGVGIGVNPVGVSGGGGGLSPIVIPSSSAANDTAVLSKLNPSVYSHPTVQGNCFN